MANGLEVKNPFTKTGDRVRFYPRTSKMVDANNSGPTLHQRAGPSHNVPPVTHQQARISHVPVTQTYVESLEPGYSSDELVSPMTVRPSIPQVRVEDASPMSSRPPIPQVRVEYVTPPSSFYGKLPYSLASSPHISDYGPSPEARKGSDATVFPHFPAEIKKPQPKPPKNAQNKGDKSSPATNMNKPLPDKPAKAARQNGGQKSGWLHAAKDIYKAGPQGEGQKAWKAYQETRREKLGHTESKQNLPTSHGSTVHQQSPKPDRTNQSALRTPPYQIPRNGRYIQSTQIPTTRKQSELSRSSYEVPLSLDSTIRPRTLNTNKTLPPVPRLDPAPKSRRQKALPLLPLFHPNHSSNSSSSKHDPTPPPLPAKDPWWRAQAEKQAAKAHAALKAKISHPNPLLAPNNGATVNVAVSAGGVGGPAAASSRSSEHIHSQDFAYMKAPPIHLTNSRPRTNESIKGKGKEVVRDDTPPTHWLDRFNPSAAAVNKTTLHRPQNQRKSSDASFVCQGLPSPELHFGRQNGVGADGKGMAKMVPEPLFSRLRVREGEKAGSDYAAVEGVLREY